MTRSPAPSRTASAESSEAQLARFIARFDPAVSEVALEARAALRTRFPAAFQLVYDNYNALAIGFSPTEKTPDVVVSVTLYPRWVSLFFFGGATLPDPLRLLQGTGRQVRSIRLESAKTLTTPGVRALLKAAVAQSDVPMPARGGGAVIIKSVSARQRPRRVPARSR
jgi:hypothetical protein